MSDLLSSLTANSILFSNAASNVANLNTRDYQSIRTTLSKTSTGDVAATTVRDTTAGVPIEDGHSSSNVDLSQEFTDIMRAKTGFEAVLSAISTREEMLDDLMNVFTDTD